ncbi:MAG TPA: SPOR domain-containing protein [Bryobacteraceae bacterium]
MSIISISQSVNDATPAAKQRQQVVRAFAGTMAFGLVLATLYVGTRIVTAKTSVKAPRPVVARPIAAPVVAPVPAAVPTVTKQDSAPLPVRRNVTPHPGEKYVQVAAFGPKALDSYLRQLESKGLHPLVAPGPADGIHRILIGPYTNTETLEQTRRTLQIVGMDSIVRSY